MKSLQLQKLNRATYNLLLDVSPMVDQESNVLQHFLTSELVSLGTKFTFSKSHFWQNSHFQNLIFHKIHISEVSFLTKFTFFRHQILVNFWGKKIEFCPSVYGVTFSSNNEQNVASTRRLKTIAGAHCGSTWEIVSVGRRTNSRFSCGGPQYSYNF